MNFSIYAPLEPFGLRKIHRQLAVQFPGHGIIADPFCHEYQTPNSWNDKNIYWSIEFHMGEFTYLKTRGERLKNS